VGDGDLDTANRLLMGLPSAPPAVKVNEEVLAPKIEAPGAGVESEGLEMKVWLVCLKSEARLRSFLVSCAES